MHGVECDLCFECYPWEVPKMNWHREKGRNRERTSFNGEQYVYVNVWAIPIPRKGHTLSASIVRVFHSISFTKMLQIHHHTINTAQPLLFFSVTSLVRPGSNEWAAYKVSNERRCAYTQHDGKQQKMKQKKNKSRRNVIMPVTHN